MKKIILITPLIILTIVLYFCKDWMLSVVPDGNYSERVVHNKYIFISVIAIIGFLFLYLTRKKR